MVHKKGGNSYFKEDKVRVIIILKYKLNLFFYKLTVPFMLFFSGNLNEFHFIVLSVKT